jgi:hypothetical protein|uniref:Uncharacterized protein n=2 Tax=unclassified Caudoviricetes TaxID=2788787 RepID=A0A8S5MP17_9CAUD|nr:MAG TPA: hypothetical protein [Myoviridae sp. ctUFx54]DAE01763.1 MAG TPA: hypothetical protein [Myoviridae sp. ctLRE27]
MAKITGVIFNGGEQIICIGELSTVIDSQLEEEPTEENKPEEPKKPKEKK